MKNGFTMIELIFIIVILGILAAVAIPKLAKTKENINKKEKLNLENKSINTTPKSQYIDKEYPTTIYTAPKN